MREILFRGKRVDNREWAEGCFSTIQEKEYYILVPCVLGLLHREVIPETVGQFTGLTDKNGVKIFEWDIVQVLDFNTLYSIVFQDGCFKLRHTKKDMNGMIWGTLERIIELQHKYPFEIIGNIHDNPELLN